MSKAKFTPISPALVVGEGPHWLEKDQSLVFVDILTSNVYRYFTETKRLQTLHVEGPRGLVSFIIPIEGREDEFAIGVGEALSTVTWSPSDPDVITRKSEQLVRVCDNPEAVRLNDGKCDPCGRLWTGTMGHEEGPGEFPPHKGALYRLDTDFKCSEIEKKVSLSNGLAWNENKDTMYYIDSLKFSVDAFDYNDQTGDVANRRVVLDFKTLGIGGLPDGMSIDVNGHLWVACYDAWKILEVDPNVGKVVQSFKCPCCNITSCCWGGPDYSTLYVTSGMKNRSDEELKSHPDSGLTFAVTGLQAKGKAPMNYHADLKILDSLKKTEKIQ